MGRSQCVDGKTDSAKERDDRCDLLLFSIRTLASRSVEAASRIYVAALRYVGVVPVMGQFKNKDRWCNSCGAKWMGHEEKETDVNIALYY